MQKLLSYKTLRESGYSGYLKEKAPVKVLQFGEGNFLRAFVDHWFDLANETADWNGKVAAIQPNGVSMAPVMNAQDCLYTLYLRGVEKGVTVDSKRIISVIDHCYAANITEDWQSLLKLMHSPELEYVASNTTEAGIVYDPESCFDQIPPRSFPAKLTVLLYERFRAGQKGLVILSCELIDDNGRELQRCCDRHAEEWGLGEEFIRWMDGECLFCNTLVDRIVPGRVRDPEQLAQMNSLNGYEDRLLDVSEVFGVWYIEGPEWLEEKLPFKKAGLNVHVVPEVAPYKKRKVRILNGAHTGFVPGAYLAGLDIVRDCMHDDTIHAFMNRLLYDEVIPVLPLEKQDCMAFAAAVTDRFGNPFVDHQLLSITLNSTAKWKARNLPTLVEYTEKYGKLPEALVMSFAAYMAFFSSGMLRRDVDALICVRPKGDEYTALDVPEVLDLFWKNRNSPDDVLVREVMKKTDWWGMDLTGIPDFETTVLRDLRWIRKEGAEKAFGRILNM